jgi:hypothetical protein
MSYRVILPAVLAALVAACGDRPAPVGPAAAAPALKRGGAPTPVDATPILDPILEQVCGFPVQLVLGGKEKIVELPRARVLFVGAGYTGTVTNLVTGKSVTLPISGAFHMTALANGDTEYVVTGRNLLAFPEGEGNLFVVTSGRFTFTVNEQGAAVRTLQGEGRLTNVCELLS